MMEKARHDWEEGWRYREPNVAELREPERTPERWMTLDQLARFTTCPLCRCCMSGDRDLPNTRNEACEDADCACHGEEA